MVSGENGLWIFHGQLSCQIHQLHASACLALPRPLYLGDPNDQNDKTFTADNEDLH
jgi:hypothetical protein